MEPRTQNRRTLVSPHRWLALRVVAVCVAILCPTAGWTGDRDFGRIGEPINLVVGYQPYFTPTWSGVIVRAQHFHERYLPKGSTVEFQIGIKGAGVITSALLTGRDPVSEGGQRERLFLPFDVTPGATALLNQMAVTLSQAGRSPVERLPPDAVRAELARAVLKDQQPAYMPGEIFAADPDGR